MNNTVLSVTAKKLGEGHIETMMSIQGSPEDIIFTLHEMIVKLNECCNGSGMMKVNNGMWLMLQDMINDTLKERTKK